MAESSAGEMIELHLGNQLRVERLPLGGAFGAPAARASRTLAGEAGGLTSFSNFCVRRGLSLALIDDVKPT